MQSSSNIRGSLFSKSSKRLILSPFIFAFLLLPTLILGLFVLVTSITEETYITYHQMMVDSGMKKEEQKKKSYEVSQNRHLVQKDLSFYKNQQLMHVNLIAEEAKLIYDQNEEHSQVIEEMKEIVCYMQEELYFLLEDGKEVVFSDQGNLKLRDENHEDAIPLKYSENMKPMQVVRKLIAKEGSYRYENGVFEGFDVVIERYIFDGHDLHKTFPDATPLLKGVAKSVVFSINGKDLNFKANGFKAVLYESIDKFKVKS